MSIKYLQDQQLNQVQQSPNNSPWAKLVAQSEMLERNKMRQPQGQAPQGTVAGNIQQQLMATQQQEGERENADLYKSQMLAQLIGSGQIPANFAAQGYASGGLTQPGTGTYAGIMVPGKPQNPMGMPTSYTPPDSQDPNAQEKKHGLLQSMIDNSIFKAPTTENFMSNLGDMASGKFLSRGFAEGGDIRGFAAGGETMAEQLARIRPEIEATLKNQGWTKEAIDRYVSAYKPEMGRGFTNQFPATTAQPPSFEDMLEMQRRKMAQTGLGVKDPNTIRIPPESGYPTGVSPKPYMQNAPQQTPAMEALAQSPEVQKLLTGPQSRVALPHITQVSESPELQEYYKSLYGPKPEVTRGDVISQLGKTNAPGEAQMRIPTREDMLRQAQGATTGTDSLAEFKNRMYGENTGALNAPRSNLMGTLLNVAEQKEALANQPKPSMTEGMSAAAQNPPHVDTMASQMSAADKANSAAKAEAEAEAAKVNAWSGAEAGKGLGEELKGIGQGIAGLFKSPVGVAGKALRAVAPVGDLMAVHDVTGSPLPMLAKAAGVNVPSSIGGVPVSQGGPSQLAMDLMGSPTARLNQVGSGISDAAQYVGDKATSAYDQFKNRLDSAQGTGTPYTPPAETSPNVAPWLNEAVNKQQTPPQTPAPDKAKFASSANKSEKAAENVQVRDKVFNQGPTANTTEGHPVGDAVTRLSALAQTDQAMNKTSDTGMGQGSILDSLYSKLKDSDVDYSDLAKRISQNEYDLARERKDGTLNAILGGVGAALSKAGSYEGVGDRVFKPGLGAIAGAGITGGLKMSAASGEAIDKKSQDNMVAAIALKKLKRESMNDVLDAISAQRQVAAIERGQDITAGTHAATNKLTAAEIGVKARMADIADLSAKADAMYKASQAKKLNIEITDANDKLLVDSLNKQLGDYANLLSGADKNSLGLTPEQRQGYQARLDGTQSQLDAIYAKYGSIAPKLKPLSGGQYQGFRNLTDQ